MAASRKLSHPQRRNFHSHLLSERLTNGDPLPLNLPADYAFIACESRSDADGFSRISSEDWGLFTNLEELEPISSGFVMGVGGPLEGGERQGGTDRFAATLEIRLLGGAMGTIRLRCPGDPAKLDELLQTEAKACRDLVHTDEDSEDIWLLSDN